MPAKQTIVTKTTTTRTRVNKNQNKNQSKKGNPNRCSKCGRFFVI